MILILQSYPLVSNDHSPEYSGRLITVIDDVRPDKLATHSRSRTDRDFRVVEAADVARTHFAEEKDDVLHQSHTISSPMSYSASGLALSSLSASSSASSSSLSPTGSGDNNDTPYYSPPLPYHTPPSPCLFTPTPQVRYSPRTFGSINSGLEDHKYIPFNESGMSSHLSPNVSTLVKPYCSEYIFLRVPSLLLFLCSATHLSRESD